MQTEARIHETEGAGKTLKMPLGQLFAEIEGQPIFLETLQIQVPHNGVIKDWDYSVLPKILRGEAGSF